MTTMFAEPEVRDHADDTCVMCNLTDDHPKVHYGLDYALPSGLRIKAPVMHHDCAPVDIKAEIIAGAHSQHPLLAARIFQAADDGARGGDLRDVILGLNMRDFGDATMMAKATSYANDILDAGFNGGASGTITLGATTYTLPFRLKFLSTVSTAATAGTEWSTSGGYTAGGVSLSGLWSTAAASASKANTGAVTVTNAPAQTWADNEEQDSTGTPKRMNFKGTPSLAKAVNSGDTCTVPIGSFTGNET
jgi:hypothetical protein